MRRQRQQVAALIPTWRHLLGQGGNFSELLFLSPAFRCTLPIAATIADCPHFGDGCLPQIPGELI